MIESDEIAVGKALELGAEEAEVYFIQGQEYNVSLESNDIKLVKSQSEDGIGIRVYKHKSLGFASDEYIQLPKPRAMTKVEGIYDPAAEEIGIDFALDNAVKILKTIPEFDKRTSVNTGSFEASVSQNVVCSLGRKNGRVLKSQWF